MRVQCTLCWIKSQCEDASAALYFKQWDEWVPVQHVRAPSATPLAKCARWLNLEGSCHLGGDEVWRVRPTTAHRTARVNLIA
jgi:hypothetical protein